MYVQTRPWCVSESKGGLSEYKGELLYLYG